MKKVNKKVMLGMSGGVDSSVAAIELLRRGYEVIGATMRLIPCSEMFKVNDAQNVIDAKKVCDKLGIKHIELDFTSIFKVKVIDKFVAGYMTAQTPNPCIMCNQCLKFNTFLTEAIKRGYDCIATGHYAGVYFDDNSGRYGLKRSRCKKDQSYVLYGMTQFELAHTLFPLEYMDKEAIRRLACDYELPIANKPDSQEICFIPDNDYAGFIQRYAGQQDEAGNFVNECGDIIGSHRGIINYTIGQRKGLGISFDRPMYVSKINPTTHEITLGDNDSLFRDELVANDLNFIPFDFPSEPIKVQAKIRYLAEPARATLTALEINKSVKVKFDEPQRAITAGQSVVFYDGDVVIGGGRIIY